MKRRDFLAHSAGVAGLIVPLSMRAQTAPQDPCPPPALSARGGTSATTACDPPPPSGSAPSWFTSMSDRTWATPVSNTLDAVKPPVNPGGTHQAICTAWTGGCVDQVRREFILAANGGHGDYGGNEVYACALQSATPAWRRLTDPSSVSGGSSASHGPANYGDGKPRSVHGYGRCTFGNDRVWYAGMDGMYPTGFQSTACYSFNRTSLQWVYHGLGVSPITASSFSWESGPSAFDRGGNRVWSAASYATGQGGLSIDASSGAITRYDWVLSGNPFGGAWSVIVNDGPSGRYWIVGSVNEGRLWILDLNNPTRWIQNATSGSPSGFQFGSGAVYHAPSRAILTWHHSGYGATLRRLSVPANPYTTTSSAYQWSSVAPAGSNSIVPPGSLNSDYQGTWGKFNIIEDMGNGRAALCLVCRTTGSTYVYRMPASI